MDEKQLIIERWRRKIEGIRSEPPINYKSIFAETLKSIANGRYSLLDLGTGAGKAIFENELETKYRRVVGIDIQPELIKLSKERAKGIKNVEFHIMDSKKTDFKPGSFDVVSSLFAPYDVSEVYRLLSDGGYFVSLVGLRGDHKELIRLFPDILTNKVISQFWRLKDQNALLRSAGFTVISNNILKYKWIFKDEEVLKQFYEKISIGHIFEGREEKLTMLKRQIDGGIPVTRILCTTVARKL